jgi:GxxExxY protein
VDGNPEQGAGGDPCGGAGAGRGQNLTQRRKDAEIILSNNAEMNALSQTVIGAAIEVHRTLGPGLLESVYEAALLHELRLSGLQARTQIVLPVIYKQINLGEGYRIDLLVEDRLVIEIKTVENLLPLYEAQLLTYLRLSGKQLGLLINFNAVVLKNGIRRVVNGL